VKKDEERKVEDEWREELKSDMLIVGVLFREVAGERNDLYCSKAKKQSVLFSRNSPLKKSALTDSVDTRE
jgi:hypothetical protein